MADKEKKIDPFDVEALEKSLNDSATRVSTIWVSYLLFGLYLVIAAGNVTHRQLFLEDPIKLPILNIELPLVGFFVLAPILFVIVHFYVLVQIVLLAHTANAYNEAVDHYLKLRADNARVRQRLANTLFAQLLAGSSREREGIIGWLLRGMAWTTLIVAPLAILVTCQLRFLPFHSQAGTWGHRALITVEITIIILFWISVRVSPIDATRSSARRRIERWIIYPSIVVFGVVFVIFYVAILSFPQERHATWTRWSIELPTTERSLMPLCNEQSIVGYLYDRYYDRLALPREDFVDDEKLAKLENASREKGTPAYTGERTRPLRDRDLRCGIFTGVDLRRADLTGADARGARFGQAELQGTSFEDANLEGADFEGTRLQDTTFADARANGANFDNARLQGAVFARTRLQGARLRFAGLQLASFNEAQLQGATLAYSDLQMASFFTAHMHGADLSSSKLHGAGFFSTELQATNFARAHLGGTFFYESPLGLAMFSKTYLWRAGSALCHDAQLTESQFDPILSVEEFGPDLRGDDPEAVDRFIDQAATNVSKDAQANFKKRLRDAVAGNVPPQDAENALRGWRECTANVLPPDEYAKRLAKQLGDLACLRHPYQQDVMIGIYNIWLAQDVVTDPFNQLLARRLLGTDSEVCPNTEDFLNDDSIETLRSFAAGAGRPEGSVGASAQ